MGAHGSTGVFSMISFIYSVLLGNDEVDIPRGGWLC
jgi:hypothetical protein